MHTTDSQRFPLMDKQTSYVILFSGLLGLTLAVLTAKPQKALDAVIAVFAGLFGALVIAPAFAEALTTASTKFGFLAWASAPPESSMFAAIVGLGGMFGFQLTVAIKDDVVAYLSGYARKKLRIHDTDA